MNILMVLNYVVLLVLTLMVQAVSVKLGINSRWKLTSLLTVRTIPAMTMLRAKEVG